MITAQELRLGNWVQETDVNGKIHYFQMNIDFLETLLVEPDIFDPIPLTPGILGKCGFEKSIVHVQDLSANDDVAKWSNKRGNFYLLDFRGMNAYYSTGFKHSHIHQDIKYLHQLQNLYFALTGQELPVKFDTVESGDIEITE